MDELLIALGQMQNDLNNIVRALKESTDSRNKGIGNSEYALAKAKLLELTLKPDLYN